MRNQIEQGPQDEFLRSLGYNSQNRGSSDYEPPEEDSRSGSSSQESEVSREISQPDS